MSLAGGADWAALFGGTGGGATTAAVPTTAAVGTAVPTTATLGTTAATAVPTGSVGTIGGTGAVAIPTAGVNAAGAGITGVGGSVVPVGTGGTLGTIGGTGSVAIPGMTTGGGGFLSGLAGSGLAGSTAQAIAKGEGGFGIAKGAALDVAGAGSVYKQLRDALKQQSAPAFAPGRPPSVLEAPRFR